ncbi:hypothetical protein ACWDFL_37545 [Streptomyces bungoensis]
MGDPIKVGMKLGDIQVEEPDKAVLKSNELVNGLVVAPANAWQVMANSLGLVVDPDNIRVSEDGHIIITDREVAEKVKEILSSPGGAEANVLGCANVYKCGAEVEAEV